MFSLTPKCLLKKPEVMTCNILYSSLPEEGEEARRKEKEKQSQIHLQSPYLPHRGPAGDASQPGSLKPNCKFKGKLSDKYLRFNVVCHVLLDKTPTQGTCSLQLWSTLPSFLLAQRWREGS
jgi:hypothetical protein